MSLEGYSPRGHKESDECKHRIRWGSWRQTHTSVGSPVLVALAFLTLRVVHTEPLSVTVRVFLPWHWLPWKCVLISCDSLHLPTSKFGTSGYESKKSCCLFSLFIFLLFFFLKDAVVSFMPEGKLEVSPFSITLVSFPGCNQYYQFLVHPFRDSLLFLKFL